MRRISKVQIKNNGIKGLRVWDMRTEPDTHGTPFINEYQTKYSAPVNTDFMAFVNALKKHMIKICKLEKNLDEMDIMINHVSKTSNDVVTVNFAVNTQGNAWYNIQAPAIADSDAYGSYPELLQIADQIFDETKKYCLGKVKPVEPKQFIMDLFDNQQATGKGGKNKVTQEERDELDTLSPEELNEKYIKHLENQGAVFLRTPEEAQGAGFLAEGDPDEPEEGDETEEEEQDEEKETDDVMSQPEAEVEQPKMRKVAS